MIGKHSAYGMALPGESVGPDPSLEKLNKSVLFMLGMKLGKVVYGNKKGQ